MLRQAQQPKTDNQFILQFNFDHLLITKLDGHKDVEIRQRKGQQMVLELNAVSCWLVQFGHPIIESVRFDCSWSDVDIVLRAVKGHVGKGTLLRFLKQLICSDRSIFP